MVFSERYFNVPSVLSLGVKICDVYNAVMDVVKKQKRAAVQITKT